MKYRRYSQVKNSAFIWLISIYSILFLFQSYAFSGVFRVFPIKLVLDRETKTGIVNIVNEGDDPLSVQMKAFEWTQDQDGKDQYKETQEIIFFPRIMKIEKEETKILRAGIKIPAAAKEKTYRLFVEEIQGPKKEGSGAQIQIAVRFGIPIFVKPLKEEVQGKIEEIRIEGEKIKFIVKNTGNSHFIIQSILVKGLDIKGAENFAKELSGWYLLTDAARTYETPISKEVCQGMSKIEIEVKTEQLLLNGKLDVNKTMCMP